MSHYQSSGKAKDSTFATESKEKQMSYGKSPYHMGSFSTAHSQLTAHTQHSVWSALDSFSTVYKIIFLFLASYH